MSADTPYFADMSGHLWANDLSELPTQGRTPSRSTVPASASNSGTSFDANGSARQHNLSPCPDQTSAPEFFPPLPLPSDNHIPNSQPPWPYWSQHPFDLPINPVAPFGLISGPRWPSPASQTSPTNDPRRSKRPRTREGNDMNHSRSSSSKPTTLGPIDTSSVSETTKTLVRSWIDNYGLRTGIADLAKCAKLDFELCRALVFQELCDGSRTSPLPTPRSSPSQDHTERPNPYASMALEEYLKEAAKTQCNELQRRKRKNVGPYQCTTRSCDYQTDTKESWHRHMDIRQPRNVFVCAECLTRSSTRPFIEHRKDKFREHLKEAHGESSSKKADIEKRSMHHQEPENPLPCGFCDNQFRTHETFREHVLKHYQDGKGGGKRWNVKHDWEEKGPIREAQRDAQSHMQAERPP